MTNLPYNVSKYLPIGKYHSDIIFKQKHIAKKNIFLLMKL